MKRFLYKLDTVFQKIVEIFLGVSMFSLTIITFLQVIFRYVLKTSIGGIEELPLYLMVVSVWFAASLLCARNQHITLDILTLLVTNRKTLAVINAITDALAAIALSYFGYCMFVYMLEGIESVTISPGLKFPMWWMSLVVVVNVVLMIIYTIKNIVIGLEVFKNGSLD